MCNLLKRNEILLLFDIDGTITYPRNVINNDIEQFLYNKIRPLSTIGIISGANIEKIYEQLNGKKILQLFDFILPENGLVQYVNGIEIHRQSFQNFYNEEFIQNFINYVLEYLSELKLPFKRGTFIEYRNGMMNISPCGRNCSKNERDIFSNYDKIHHIRENMIKNLQIKLKNYNFTYSIGGQISFDVFPNGWDKTYCLNYITENYNFKEIHFFGDKTEPGGNDYEIYVDPRTIGHKVENPEDTIRILTQMFNL